MKSDFELIQRKIGGNEDVHIYPVFDVHYKTAGYLGKEFESYLARIADDKNGYIVIGGDLLNNATKQSVSNCFDDLRPREAKRRISEMLFPYRDKILAAIPGNHERRNKDVDDCPIYDIMCKLDREELYRENAAFIKLRIGNPLGDGQKNPTYVIGAVHGDGGGSMTGSAVNKNERFGANFSGLDLLLVGHSHKPFITSPCRIVIDPHNNKISMKSYKVVCATSWLNYGGYALQKMLTPSSNAPQVITLCGNHKEVIAQM